MTPLCFNDVSLLDIDKGISRTPTFVRHSNYQEMGPAPKHGFMWPRQTEGIRRCMVYKQSEH